ncbi:hypothetical protein H2203_003494 [Taxawa tesnikishii (nom. ined.)]|nr:hypothetical protein H2203_003494 [Dothideales sp. JES 119]
MRFPPFGDPTPRPGLHPIPDTQPLTLEAALLPPLLYYLALLFLPPSPPPTVDPLTAKTLRNVLALLAGFLFFRLPLAYHVPQSIGLTYQLSLVGLYGGCRVVDAFFISPFLFGHVPRRVRYQHVIRLETPPQASYTEPIRPREPPAQDSSGTPQISEGSFRLDTAIDALSGSSSNSYTLLKRTLNGPSREPILETATSEDGWPHGFLARAAWALELEMSMRGVGFTWTTADVRHTRKTWLPTIGNRVHSILIHALPVLAVSFTTIRTIYITHLEDELASKGLAKHAEHLFDDRLSFALQLLLTAALGAFLISVASRLLPPLYTSRIWDIRSVRGFWAYGWHRLFARLFLVYGVWPGEWLERKLTGKRSEEPADMGKIVGGFILSAFVHSFAVRSVLAGEWGKASGEAKFFVVNGTAVILEEVVVRQVKSLREKKGRPAEAWYDGWIGRLWCYTVLLVSGRNFARGWTNAGLVREISAR